MRDLEPCGLCHEMHDPEELIEFDGMQLCGACYDRNTISCDHCGARLWRENNAGDSDTFLCQRCYDNHYNTCSNCERVIEYAG